MALWRETFKKFATPLTRLTGSEWADKFRVVPAGTSPEPGPWRTSRTPYLKEPVDVATDRDTEIVVLEFSSQLGKSEGLLNIIGFFADQEPAPQLMLQPTVEMAEAFSKERIEPMFRSSPGLTDKLETGKDGRGSAKKSSTTIRMKHFPGGYLALVGANSPAGLASRPIRVLLCDEVDRYGVTKEGDPLKLAIQRTQNFANRKIVLVSTPTVKGVSKIDDWFERSDKRYFLVPCPHCGHMHSYQWANVKWDKDENGKALPMTAAMYCPECGAQERGPYKPDVRALAKGVWTPTAKSDIAGFHCNALYSPWVNLHDLVDDFETATANQDRNGLMEFVNLKLGEAWEQINPDADAWEALSMRRETYPSDHLPNGVLLLTAGVDVQRNRIECTVYGWGHGRECWAICHRILWGRPDDPKTWEALDGVLMQKYKHPLGVELSVICTCVDSGDGAFTSEVYAYTRARERMRIFSIKGRGGQLPFIGKPVRVGMEKALLFPLGVDSGKRLVMDRLAVESPGPNFVHFDESTDAGFSDEFFHQLTAETLENKFERGVVTQRWVKIRERNEAFDTAVYATAALEIVKPNFDMLEELYSNQLKSTTTSTTVRPRRRRGTVSSGVSL